MGKEFDVMTLFLNSILAVTTLDWLKSNYDGVLFWQSAYSGIRDNFDTYVEKSDDVRTIIMGFYFDNLRILALENIWYVCRIIGWRN